jgi:hypothetical protein
MRDAPACETTRADTQCVRQCHPTADPPGGAVGGASISLAIPRPLDLPEVPGWGLPFAYGSTQADCHMAGFAVDHLPLVRTLALCHFCMDKGKPVGGHVVPENGLPRREMRPLAPLGRSRWQMTVLTPRRSLARSELSPLFRMESDSRNDRYRGGPRAKCRVAHLVVGGGAPCRPWRNTGAGRFKALKNGHGTTAKGLRFRRADGGQSSLGWISNVRRLGLNAVRNRRFRRSMAFA